MRLSRGDDGDDRHGRNRFLTLSLEKQKIVSQDMCVIAQIR